MKHVVSGLMKLKNWAFFATAKQVRRILPITSQWQYSGPSVPSITTTSAQTTQIPMSTPQGPKLELIEATKVSYHSICSHQCWSCTSNHEGTSGQEGDLVNLPLGCFGRATVWSSAYRIPRIIVLHEIAYSFVLWNGRSGDRSTGHQFRLFQCMRNSSLGASSSGGYHFIPSPRSWRTMCWATCRRLLFFRGRKSKKC